MYLFTYPKLNLERIAHCGHNLYFVDYYKQNEILKN